MEGLASTLWQDILEMTENVKKTGEQKLLPNPAAWTASLKALLAWAIKDSRPVI